jgi:acyl-CoA synthetase (AMP-forming)/AMP-acid ligase II
VTAIDEDTLPGRLHQLAATDPDAPAYTFLGGSDAGSRSITWSQLNQRAAALGSHLISQGATGQPVLLAMKSSLEFVESLFACWYAAAIAVPVSLPRHQRLESRLKGIIADSGVRLAIGTAETREHLSGGPAHAVPLTWIAPDAAATPGTDWPDERAAQSHVALLQYTSGSTGTPRGVIVTHANLAHNSALIAEACGHQRGDVIAGWLPLFHDMGLIGLVLQAVGAGVHCVLMAPEKFLMRPWVWLQMISDYRACSSPAPNFAYDLCVDRVGLERRATLDLSCWRNALNGSEPVRAATLERFAAAFSGCGFRRSAFFPCYGLAEATLLVTAPVKAHEIVRRNIEGSLVATEDVGGYVGCGRPVRDTRLAIVDPQSRAALRSGEVGEIWVGGRSVTSGYWKDPHSTGAMFGGTLETNRGEHRPDTGWLRTGDLGFQDATGELFITGRLRELIIIAGRNYFPVDIERTVESADSSIAVSGVVAFSADVDGLERLIIAAEVRRPSVARGERGAFDVRAVCGRIRLAVSAENEVAPFDIALLRPGALPRTSSGKLQRLATRDAYLNNTLELLESSPDALARI